MPKIVDSSERLDEIAAAVCRVIARDGFDQATLRNVAAEAGLAIGSVRHYAGSHAELLDHAMRVLGERLRARLMAHVDRLDGAADKLPIVLDLLAEILPIDAQRREETLVWLEFTAAARTRPELAEHAGQLYAGVRTLVRRVLARTAEAGGLAGQDVELETERLAALLDGLAVNGVNHPERLPASRMREILSRHLESVRAPN